MPVKYAGPMLDGAMIPNRGDIQEQPLTTSVPVLKAGQDTALQVEFTKFGA